MESMKFLDEPELCVKDEDLLPPAPRRFSNQLDHNLCVPLQKKRLTDEQYVLQKEAYMQSGDIKMVLYALNNVESDPVIITEETPLNNDGKLFRKLPMVCNFFRNKVYVDSRMASQQWDSFDMEFPRIMIDGVTFG